MEHLEDYYYIYDLDPHLCKDTWSMVQFWISDWLNWAYMQNEYAVIVLKDMNKYKKALILYHQRINIERI